MAGALVQLFKSDKKGESTLAAVQTVSRLVVTSRYKIREDLLRWFARRHHRLPPAGDRAQRCLRVTACWTCRCTRR